MFSLPKSCYGCLPPKIRVSFCPCSAHDDKVGSITYRRILGLFLDIPWSVGGNVGQTWSNMVKQCHKPSNHPPVITFFFKFYRWYGCHSQSWVVYDIVSPTLGFIDPGRMGGLNITNGRLNELGESSKDIRSIGEYVFWLVVGPPL